MVKKLYGSITFGTRHVWFTVVTHWWACIPDRSGLWFVVGMAIHFTPVYVCLWVLFCRTRPLVDVSTEVSNRHLQKVRLQLAEHSRERISPTTTDQFQHRDPIRSLAVGRWTSSAPNDEFCCQKLLVSCWCNRALRMEKNSSHEAQHPGLGAMNPVTAFLHLFWLPANDTRLFWYTRRPLSTLVWLWFEVTKVNVQGLGTTRWVCTGFTAWLFVWMGSSQLQRARIAVVEYTRWVFWKLRGERGRERERVKTGDDRLRRRRRRDWKTDVSISRLTYEQQANVFRSTAPATVSNEGLDSGGVTVRTVPPRNTTHVACTGCRHVDRWQMFSSPSHMPAGPSLNATLASIVRPSTVSRSVAHCERSSVHAVELSNDGCSPKNNDFFVASRLPRTDCLRGLHRWLFFAFLKLGGFLVIFFPSQKTHCRRVGPHTTERSIVFVYVYFLCQVLQYRCIFYGIF